MLLDISVRLRSEVSRAAICVSDGKRPSPSKLQIIDECVPRCGYSLTGDFASAGRYLRDTLFYLLCSFASGSPFQRYAPGLLEEQKASEQVQNNENMLTATEKALEKLRVSQAFPRRPSAIYLCNEEFFA